MHLLLHSLQILQRCVQFPPENCDHYTCTVCQPQKKFLHSPFQLHVLGLQQLDLSHSMLEMSSALVNKAMHLMTCDALAPDHVCHITCMLNLSSPGLQNSCCHCDDQYRYGSSQLQDEPMSQPLRCFLVNLCCSLSQPTSASAPSPILASYTECIAKTMPVYLL